MKFITPGQGHPTLKFWQLILWRWLSTLAAYLFLSLAYSLISLAFQIPFSHAHAPETVVAEGANPFGKATFVVSFTLKNPPLPYGMTLGVSGSRIGNADGEPLGVLDGQFHRHGRARLGVRERGDGDRTAVDGDVVGFLGDYECQHELLCGGVESGVL